MRILLINQFFWPDAAPTSILLTDVAEALAAKGHDVHVICSATSYSANADRCKPCIDIHAVECIAFGRAARRRFGSYITFLARAAVASLRVPRPDLVITMTTPPLLQLVGLLVKAVHGCPALSWEMDVYPDILWGVRDGAGDGLTWRLVRCLFTSVRRRLDGIIALGLCMHRRFVAAGLPVGRVYVAENWAAARSATPLLSLQNRPLTIVYSGNCGHAHEFETILDIAEELVPDTRFAFIIAGSGARRVWIDQQVTDRALTNVDVREYQHSDSYTLLLDRAHIGVVTQRMSTEGCVVPSKYYSLLSAGRPVLFIGPARSTVAESILQQRCGWCIEPGSVAEGVTLLRELADSPDLLAEAATRAGALYSERHTTAVGVKRIVDIAESTATCPPRCTARQV
jgi:colanic acid biosynthesis glycosyl transferase WcaI